MAIIIVDTGTASFTMNGIAYLKNFQSLVIGSSIRIVNAYDSKLILLNNTSYTDFTVDGNTFANVLFLQEDLVSKLFNRPATGNGILDVVSSNTVTFHNTSGTRNGSWSEPRTGAIILSNSGAIEGGTAVMVWSGLSNPTFTGDFVGKINLAGEITSSGLYSIYFHYLNGQININIFGSTGSAGGDITPPATMAIINLIGSGDNIPPATMAITDLSGDITPPATMAITLIT